MPSARSCIEAHEWREHVNASCRNLRGAISRLRETAARVRGPIGPSGGNAPRSHCRASPRRAQASSTTSKLYVRSTIHVRVTCVQVDTVLHDVASSVHRIGTRGGRLRAVSSRGQDDRAPQRAHAHAIVGFGRRVSNHDLASAETVQDLAGHRIAMAGGHGASARPSGFDDEYARAITASEYRARRHRRRKLGIPPHKDEQSGERNARQRSAAEERGRGAKAFPQDAGN